MNSNHNSGTFLVSHLKNNNIILHWEKMDGASPQLTQQIKNASDILIQTYTEQELEFARQHPQAIKDEYFLKSLAPLFEQSVIDWNIVETQIRDIFHQFFTTTNFAQFCTEGENHIIVTAIDSITDKMLGFIQFISIPAYAVGDLKVGMFGVHADMHNLDLKELLMSSIFKIIPDIQRLFIHVRSTNEQALALYESWGFKPMGEQQGYWKNMECIVAYNTYLPERADYYIKNVE